MQNEEPTAEEIESGAYYRAARAWYSDLFHRPIAERSYYVVVIALALINLFFAVMSFAEIFPIHTRVPFIVYSNDVWEELPRIKPVNPGKKINENLAVKQFLLEGYLLARESYDMQKYELRYRSVWSQSAPEVFERYKALMDASNVYGPYHLYTNRARRVVHPLSVEYTQDAQGTHARITFTAVVVAVADSQEESRSKWQADITFQYTPFVVDQSLDRRHWWLAHVFGLTGDAPKASDDTPKVVPMTFLVTDYQVKELLE